MVTWIVAALGPFLTDGEQVAESARSRLANAGPTATRKFVFDS